MLRTGSRATSAPTLLRRTLSSPAVAAAPTSRLRQSSLYDFRSPGRYND